MNVGDGTWYVSGGDCGGGGDGWSEDSGGAWGGKCGVGADKLRDHSGGAQWR